MREAIKKLRTALQPPGSTRKVARLCGISQPTIVQLAAELHEPRHKTKLKLKRNLGIELEDWDQ